jgi:hypothetical protein
VIRRVPGLEARCREAAARTTPTSFEIRWPDTKRWYRFRLVPVSEGLAWYVTDITEPHIRQAEQEAAERMAAKRAARIQDLASALAEAVTSLDIVAAVADRVLPPFGASGLIIQVVEDGRMRTVGSIGYSQPFLDLVNGPVPDLTPAADVLRRRRPSFISSADEYKRRYPATADVLAVCGKQAWAYLPLVVSGQVVGLCVLSFDRSRLLTGAERATDHAQRPNRSGSGARPALRRRARPVSGAAARPAAPAAARGAGRHRGGQVSPRRTGHGRRGRLV